MSQTVYVDRTASAHAAPARAKAPWGKWSNGTKKTANHYAGQGTAPLSNEQKAKLCITARAASEKVHGHAPADTATFNAWRQAEQRKAIGKDSLTTATQGDFLPLLAHFAELAGESGVALNAHLKEATGPQRVALHKLKTECAARGLDLAWAASICRSKFKCDLDQATSKQLWNLVFDVRNSKHKPTAKPAKTGPLGPLPAKLVFKKIGTKPAPSGEENPF